MLPSLRSHEEYIEFVDKNLKDVPKAHEHVVFKLLLIDLTPLRILFLPLYCLTFGRIGFSPEDLMRSFIAMVLCGITSPTDWIQNYLCDENGFYAIISGFLPENVPSVGCIYGFMLRILSIPKYCKEKHIKKKRKRLTRNQKRQLKDDKKKVTKRHAKIVSKLSKRFERITQNQEGLYVHEHEQMINSILELCCINESQRRKLLDKQNLNVSGDGTKLKTHSKRYGTKVCSCKKYNCDCPRFYNDIDASVGYDSYHDTYIFGYNFYQLNSWDFKSNSELPVYIMMATAKRHDASLGMYAMHRATQLFNIKNACFDKAHDATDFYRLSRDIWDANFFIPLNTTNEGNLKNLPMAYIDSFGIPHCQAEYQMYYSGYCKDRDRIKWRCPIHACKKNQGLDCDFINICSPSSYGRVVYTHPADNPRLFPTVPRTSQKWKKTYDKRTSAERIFKREKDDFKLTQFKTRNKERRLFYALLTAIAVHVETWFRQDSEEEIEKAA